MYTHTAPLPPPKPGSHEISGMSTPALSQSPRPPPLPEVPAHGGDFHAVNAQHQATSQVQDIPDPGEQWLPKFLEDKSKHDLATILSSPTLLSALTHSPATSHASLRASDAVLSAALAENVELAQHLLELEARVAAARGQASAALLSTHALERAWRAKQGDMDMALAPFAPASLYQRLAAGVAEQEGVCYALEESFLDGGSGKGSEGGGGMATEREAGEWVRRYREARKLYYLRQERRERWDEGRVGGWR